MLPYFYDPSMFIYCFSSNFVENVVLEREQGGRDVISCPVPCVLHCIEGEFEQIITKIRLSIKQQLTNFRIVFLPHTNTVILLYSITDLDCKTVGFFLKISKEIGNLPLEAWRKSLTRVRREKKKRILPSLALCFQPRSGPFSFV